MNDLAGRVRRHTAAELLRRMDDDTVERLAAAAATPAATERRFDELDRERDTDRAAVDR